MDELSSGTIAFTVIPQANGRCVGRLTSTLAGGNGAGKAFHGQTANHAIANALENLARALRMEVEAGQSLDWDAVDRSPSGKVIDKHFHVILHYERLVEDESKFDAMQNTQLGNTVVENAELTIIQVDPDIPKLAWKRRS
jgi:trehalose-6-phosphatase